MSNMAEAQYAVVHTTQRGGSIAKVENVWLLTIPRVLLDDYRVILRELCQDGPDLHHFELMPLQRGTLVGIQEQLRQVC